jgi:DNA polymerase II large subunit
MFGTLDMEKLSTIVHVSSDNLNKIIKNPISSKISARAAVNISQKIGIPLHPNNTFYWSLISIADLVSLAETLEKGNVIIEEGKVKKSVHKMNRAFKRILEKLAVPHEVINDEFIVISANNTFSLFFTLGMLDRSKKGIVPSKINEMTDKTVLEIVSSLSGIKIMDSAGTFIGARMGRPEKAKMRKLTGSPHTLFPVGEEGGRLRSIQSAVEHNKITADFPIYYCPSCKKESILSTCEMCSKATRRMFYCKECGVIEKEDCRHGKAHRYRSKEVDINALFDSALKQINLKVYPDVIKGVRGTSNKDHIPEHIAKGILRAKHEVYVNKDGTTRYDMTELPITHFTPDEIGTSVEKLREMGYTKDIHGRDLKDANQILEIKPQDLILPCNDTMDEDSADKVLFDVASFIDELLVNFYGLKPYYNLKSPSDLTGHLVIGLAPHISAGTIGRIIGFSKTQGCFAHPLYHAALRRDCDGDENCVMLVLDAFINFSRQFLPDKRGSRTMDSPLVLTLRLIPSEVDDMAHGIDVVWKYPLGFYEAALKYTNPKDYPIEQLRARLDTPSQYEGMGYTHAVSSVNKGVLISAYKTLPTMEDKLKGQMELAEKIDAVEASDVAEAVIVKHFMKDIRGNMRKFSQQQFRCVACNEKFRRPPLVGKCTKCGGKIIFTISEGSVGKYLEPSISLATKYNVSPYLKQNLELAKRSFEAMFGKDKEKQAGLGEWFSEE